MGRAGGRTWAVRLGSRASPIVGPVGKTPPCRSMSCRNTSASCAALFNKFDYHPSLYGHIGQGCVHCRVPVRSLYTAGHREV